MSRAHRDHLAALTEEAIEQAQQAHHYARWLAALMTAIGDTLESEGPAGLEARASRARDLASLGQYLADDLAGHMSQREAELLQQPAYKE